MSKGRAGTRKSYAPAASHLDLEDRSGWKDRTDFEEHCRRHDQPQPQNTTLCYQKRGIASAPQGGLPQCLSISPMRLVAPITRVLWLAWQYTEVTAIVVFSMLDDHTACLKRQPCMEAPETRRPFGGAPTATSVTPRACPCRVRTQAPRSRRERLLLAAPRSVPRAAAQHEPCRDRVAQGGRSDLRRD